MADLAVKRDTCQKKIYIYIYILSVYTYSVVNKRLRIKEFFYSFNFYQIQSNVLLCNIVSDG